MGTSDTSIGSITVEAGFSRSAFHAYFATKPEVFREVVADLRDEFVAGHEHLGIEDSHELGRISTLVRLAAHSANAALLTVIERKRSHRTASSPSIGLP